MGVTEEATKCKYGVFQREIIFLVKLVGITQLLPIGDIREKRKERSSVAVASRRTQSALQYRFKRGTDSESI